MSEQKNELRQIITDALVSMVSGVTGLVPPSGPGAIPDFIQAPIDRAVEKISASLPVGVPDDPLPHWEPCNPGCDPEFNGSRSRYCAELCHNAREALAAAPTVKAEQADEAKRIDKQCRDDVAAALGFVRGGDYAWSYLLTQIKECVRVAETASLPATGSADLTRVKCPCCPYEYDADSYDAGFIAGSGMCQVCDAAMPPKDLPAAGSAVEVLLPALRQYRHNFGGDELIPAYDYEQTNRIVAALSAQQSASIADYEECLSEQRRLVRELDVLLNGEDGAAPQASLCDIVGQVSSIVRDEGLPLLAAFSARKSAPERVSVPVELLERVTTWREGDEGDSGRSELRALLASHGRGEA